MCAISKILLSLEYIWKTRKPGSCIHELVFQNISQESTRTFKMTDMLFKLMPSIFYIPKKARKEKQNYIIKKTCSGRKKLVFTLVGDVFLPLGSSKI